MGCGLDGECGDEMVGRWGISGEYFSEGNIFSLTLNHISSPPRCLLHVYLEKFRQRAMKYRLKEMQ